MSSSPSTWDPITPELSSADIKQMMGTEDTLLQAVLDEADHEQKLFTIGDTQRVILVAGDTIDNAIWQVYMA